MPIRPSLFKISIVNVMPLVMQDGTVNASAPPLFIPELALGILVEQAYAEVDDTGGFGG
jgi:hypothetical protein